MTVSEILAHADALGVRLHADGSELKAQWCADAPPPPEFVATLKSHKPAIQAALLELRSFHWRDHFEERAGIREYDGGLSRSDAEARALDDCVARWRALNPLPASSNEFCVHCGKARPDTPVLADGGHAWLHRECWAPMNAERSETARVAIVAALKASRDFDARQEISTLREKQGEGA